MPPSPLEESFLAAWPRLCRANGIEPVMPEREYHFNPAGKRNPYRFDFAWPAAKVAVEMEGGVWTQGRHTRPVGYLADMNKYNAAAASGWIVLRFSESHLQSDPQGMFETICECLNRDEGIDH